MAKIGLKIITPEKQVFDSEVDSLTIPSTDGEMGIFPGHVDLMAKIIPGELKIKNSNKTEILAVGAGFVQIESGKVTILADLAKDVSDIDERAVEEAKKRAEKALEDKLSAEEYAETLAILERSLAQLKVKRRHRAR